jgi:heavy metal translocating P-type ATPase
LAFLLNLLIVFILNTVLGYSKLAGADGAASMKISASGQALPKQPRYDANGAQEALPAIPNIVPHVPVHEHSWDRIDLLRIGLVAFAAAAAWFHVWEPFPSFSLIGILATLVGGYPIFREAIENVVERRMTMELSMTIALLAALFIRQFFTALIITLFVLVAEVLEGMTVGRGRKAIKDLLDLLPQTAEVLKHGSPIELPLTMVEQGDRILVRPGARIPADGQVRRGTSYVDQAAITGEAMPVEKRTGAHVFAGTINQTGAIEVTVTQLGADTSFGKIIAAVEQAEHSRAPIQRMADQLAGYLVYFALGSAVLTFLITHNLRSTISVIIVAGACGIAAGTPLAILGAIGRSARAGVIVKGGMFLEQLAKVDTVVLDKTGTLTFGVPSVVAVHPAPGVTAQDLLRYSAIAERDSEHPLGRALVEYARCLLGPIKAPAQFQYVPGKGVTAEVDDCEICVGSAAFLAEHRVEGPMFALQNGRSGVLVARNGKYLGAILVEDQLRDEAGEAVREMNSMGIATILLTGDSASQALRVAAQLHIEDVRYSLQPHEKLSAISTLQQSNKKVAMVGDGINDAPALAQADVGIAMGSGTDVARESADVVLIGNNLLKLRDALRIARSCRAIIFQNFYGTLAVDLAGIILAACGFLTPLLAALIHVTSELAFILNSTRLLPARQPRIAAQGSAAKPA